MGKFFGLLVSLSIFFGLNGCGSDSGDHKETKNRQQEPELENPNDFLSYNLEEVDPSTKIFLIGGSRLGANFGQEITDQKKHWRSLGVSESEIACYYNIPDPKSFHDDREQYLNLADDLADCHVASMSRIRNDMEGVEKGHELYFYVTSHGSSPISHTIGRVKDKEEIDEEKLKQLKLNAENYPFLEQYWISIDAVGPWAVDGPKVFEAALQGSPEEVMLTPTTLKKLLNQWPVDSYKYVVIQGCFSGGFIEEEDETFKRQTLRDVPNITVLTAARHDRTSFGCKLDEDRTFFGGTYNDVVFELNKPIHQLSFYNIYNSVAERVGKLEEAEKVEKPSLPQYFSNRSFGPTTWIVETK